MKRQNFFNKSIAMLLFIIMIVTTIPVNAEEVKLKQNVISPWAYGEFFNAETMGLLPDSWAKELNDYTKQIGVEKATQLLSASESKLKEMQKEVVNKIEVPKLEDSVTRKEMMEQTYALVAQYDDTANNSADDAAIKYLVDNHIIKGDGNSLALERGCSKQEALIILMRAIRHIYYKNELGGKGFAWTVKNGKNTVTLLGSIHLANSRIHPFDKKLVDAFKKSDKLVLELDLLKLTQNPLVLLKMNQYQDGSTLESKIGKENYKLAGEFLKSKGISIDIFKNYKPWAFNLLLQQIKEQYSVKQSNLKIQPKYGIDMWFNNQAYLMKKPVIELETVDSQSKVLNSLPIETQVEELESTLKDINNSKDETKEMQNINKMLQAWKTNDEEKFGKAFDIKELEKTDFGKNLLEKRDANMAKKIDEMLKSEGENNYFVVVGSGHYFSKNNILKQLKAKGYEVKKFYE